MEYRNILPALDYRKQFSIAQVNLMQLIQEERIRKRMQHGKGKRSNLSASDTFASGKKYFGKARNGE